MQTEVQTIADVAYDADRTKLLVRFAGGDCYVYVGVPGEVHRSFIDAPSPAGFFTEQICDCYPYNRVEA